MKLKINWDDPNAEFYGVRKVQLHSQNLDPSLMHERLGYWLFAEMGVVVPRSTHARVMINGEFAGVFALTEQIDGRFTRENFENGKGNLYKEAWPFDADGSARGRRELIAALETNEDDNPTRRDHDRLHGRARCARAPEDRLDVLAEHDRRAESAGDVGRRPGDSQRRRCTALVLLSGPCAPHNFFWYEDPDSEQLWLIPWDLDNAFETLGVGGLTADFIRIADPLFQTTSDCLPFAFGNFGLLQRSASCDPIIGTVAALTAEYDALRAELVAGPMSAESVTEQLAEWSAQIEPSVAEYSERAPDGAHRRTVESGGRDAAVRHRRLHSLAKGADCAQLVVHRGGRGRDSGVGVRALLPSLSAARHGAGHRQYQHQRAGGGDGFVARRGRGWVGARSLRRAVHHPVAFAGAGPGGGRLLLLGDRARPAWWSARSRPTGCRRR